MAEVVCIEKRAPVDGLALFAREMYHGIAERPGADYPGLQYRYGDQLTHPLELTVNTHDMGGIFQPSINWILPEAAKHALEDVHGIAFLEVRFKKVFCQPYALAVEPDLMAELEDIDDVWDTFEHDPSLAGTVGSWYELIIPNYLDVAAADLAGGTRLRLDPQWSSGILELVVSPRLLQSCPLFWNDSVFARPDVFAALEPFVDPRHFLVRHLAL